MRWVAAITALAVLLTFVPTARARTEYRHPSGIAILPANDIPAMLAEYDRASEAALEPLKGAYSDARDLAEQLPELFGIPWLDVTGRRVVVRIAQPPGESIARTWMSSGYQRGNGTKPAPSLRPTQVVTLEPTTRSFARLDAIRNATLDDPALGIRGGASRIWTIGIDEESQRVVFESDRISDPFLYALASGYGTDAVAVRIDPLSGPFNSEPAPTLVPVTSATHLDDAPRALVLAGALALGGTLPFALLAVLSRRRRGLVRRGPSG